MPFQGNDFVRNQNFVRDRDLGAPENTISADKVDDEFDNVADALTATKIEAATAVSAVRGGIDEARNTLQKLADWIAAGLSFTGIIRAPSAQFDALTVGTSAGAQTDVIHVNSIGDTHISLDRAGVQRAYLQTRTDTARLGTLSHVLDLRDDGVLLWTGPTMTLAGKTVGGETIGTGTPSGGQPGDKFFKV